MEKIPFLDLSIQDKEERNALLSSIEVVFKHGRIILGPEVLEFEKKIASYCHRKYAIGVASGTDSLILSLRALGVKKGDKIITNAYSWIATANAIFSLGASPVFADILPDLTLDPHSVRNLITEKTKGIIAVNYSGRICDFQKLQLIADENELFLIEDASQSFGAKRNNCIAGSFGHISCISLNPMKTLAACGEAGVVLTNNKSIKELIEIDRYNGMENKTICIKPGLNSRIDTLQAAILLHRFKMINQIIDKRRKIAQYYNQELKSSGIHVFEDQKDMCSSYFSYFIETKHRDALLSYLDSRKIECKIRDSDYLPAQPAYRTCKNNAIYANKLYPNLLLLPMSENLQKSQIIRIINNINQFRSNDRKL